MTDNTDLIHALEMGAKGYGHHLPLLSEAAATIASLTAERDTIERDLKHVRSMAGKSRGELESALEAAENRLAVKDAALEPFCRLADIVLGEAPPEAQTVVVFTDCQGRKRSMSLDDFRRARSAREA